MDYHDKDYAFAAGGLLWKILDRPKFEAKSLRYRVTAVVILVLGCWLPLAILTLFQLGFNQFFHLFVRDVATHVRFLLVMPLLIFSRGIVNTSFNHAISFFYETKIVDDTNAEAFEHVMNKIEHWKNLKVIDFLFIILIYASFFMRQGNVVNNAQVYAPWSSVEHGITHAGWWYLALSLPVLQLLLFRWLYTIILWIIFLRKITKVNLHLSSLHPDGVGGLGFLQYMQLSFFPVALAFSALTAGVMNNLIIFSGISIVDYKMAFGSMFLFVLLLFILPLLLLLPMLARVKRKYFMQYSLEAWPIARQYEKELVAGTKDDQRPDTSWHVDLIGSFEKTAEMKVLLVNKTIIIAFVAAVALPFIPVVAQQVPLKEVFLNLAGKILG
jgi:hypothetical protein